MLGNRENLDFAYFFDEMPRLQLNISEFGKDNPNSIRRSQPYFESIFSKNDPHSYSSTV